MEKRGMIISCIIILAYFLFPASLFAAGGVEEEIIKEQIPFDIAVFIPGVVAGSAVYEQLVSGAERAAAEYDNAAVKVLEGGFNQGEWEEKVMSLAATGEYELIVSGNGAMPYVAMPVAEAFPDQKFLILDSIIEHPQMHTILYNQIEQGYMIGYLAGLITKSAMTSANSDLKIGMIAGQEYPAMNIMIQPGYEMGAQAVDSGISVDYRVLGNWYDANKAGELAKSMMDAGVDIILTIAGGANQGVIAAAMERGVYVLYFDDDSYDVAPGTIVGCTELMQDRAAYESIKSAIEGTLEFGIAQIVTTADGYLDFVDSNPLYTESVSREVQAEMDKMLAEIRGGEINLEIPKYW